MRRGASEGVRQAILVVDGSDTSRRRLKNVLRGPLRDVFVAGTANEALHALDDLRPDLVFVSLDLPDLPGARAIDFLGERAGVPVVATCEAPTVQRAVEAVRRGAADLLAMPCSREDAEEAVERVLSEARSRRALEHVQDDVHDRYGFTHLLTQSPRMLEVFDDIRRVASTDAIVLIQGETGTGKELVSRAIHTRSRRSERPFVAVNCGAFTESLLESELFGHERGSFTGAVGRREGLFEMADTGTLFLDELGETTLNVQVNLLRVLEEMSFRRVGGRDSIHVDVRIVAATNVELETAVEKGAFREDLFYRLNVFPIHLPPLRSRREDIPLLMRHFMDEIGGEYEMETPVVAVEAMQSILSYAWPGNVRQLRAMCERWVITRSGQRLEREHLPTGMTGEVRPDDALGGFHVDGAAAMKDSTDRVLAQVERAYLHKALRRHGGHLERTAAHAGVSRRTLYTKMKQYGLEASDYR